MSFSVSRRYLQKTDLTATLSSDKAANILGLLDRPSQLRKTFQDDILNYEVRDANIIAHAYFVKTDKSKKAEARPAESDISVLAELDVVVG